MPAASTVKLTVDQFRALGEDPPGVRLELVDGEIEVSPSPAPQHDDTTFLLRSILHAHVVAHNLGRVHGDVDTPLDAHNVRRPDILWFRRDRLDLVTRDRLLGLPDLAVEVVSPGSVKTDRQTKFEVYASVGIPFYWIVNPKRREIEAYTLRGDRYALAAQGAGDAAVQLPPFPDLTIPLSRIW